VSTDCNNKYFLKIILVLLPTVLFSLGQVALVQSALAGPYELTKGKGVPVCEAYKSNLDSFIHYPNPMSCQREVNAKLGLFQKPIWTELDVWKNRSLLKEVDKLLGLGRSYGDAEKNPNEWERTLKRRIKIHGAVLLTTRIDIDNDGILDNVLKYLNGDCGSSHFYGTPIFVLNSAKSAIDLKKTYPLLQSPDAVTSDFAGRWGYTMYDVLIYKSRVYFDYWNDQEDQKGVLKLFETRDGKTTEICSVNYINSPR